MAYEIGRNNQIRYLIKIDGSNQKDKDYLDANKKEVVMGERYHRSDKDDSFAVPDGIFMPFNRDRETGLLKVINIETNQVRYFSRQQFSKMSKRK